MLTRRQLASGFAAIGALLAAGGVERAYDRGVFGRRLAQAYAPWDALPAAGDETPFGLIRAAILAASPHNTQPWLFRLTPEGVTLLADYARHLGAFDPYRREMCIGLGCSLETLAIAASASLLDSEITFTQGRLQLEPGNSPKEIAQVRFRALGPNAGPDPLSAFVSRRHTHRGTYEPDRPLPAALLSHWQSIAAQSGVELMLVPKSAAGRDRFDAAIVGATQAIIDDPEMVSASESWMRTAGDDVLAHRDGLTLDAQAMPPLLLAAAKMLPPLPAATSNAYWLRATRDVHVASAPLLGYIRVNDPLNIATCLNVGRAWARIQLSGTASGVSLQPLNQIPECIDRERQLARAPESLGAFLELAGEGGIPTFGFRAGFALGPGGVSPRRAIEDVVLKNA